MKINTFWNHIHWTIDLDHGIDISIPLVPGKMTPNCFYAPFFQASPYKSGDFIGLVSKGSPVNFLNLTINPHGNGTHTECAGHITAQPITIHKALTKFNYFGELLSVFPTMSSNGDRIITRSSLENLGKKFPVDVLILRTLPNDDTKPDRNYSGTNPPYLEEDAMALLNEWGIKHLILDLPSVDREEDGGQLSGHKKFWETPEGLDHEKTITEMVFIPDQIRDGLYFVQFSIISVETDASPSKIILYTPVQQT